MTRSWFTIDGALDLFYGFGTTLVATDQLGRHAIGFEQDPSRGHFAATRIQPPSRVIVDDAHNVARYDLPHASLLFTSPPYTSFRGWDDEGFAAYEQDFRQVFTTLANVVPPNGKVVLEMSNVRDGRNVRTVAWDAVRILANVFDFEGEQVRCNPSPHPAGPGFDHSYLLVFSHDRQLSSGGQD